MVAALVGLRTALTRRLTPAPPASCPLVLPDPPPAEPRRERVERPPLPDLARALALGRLLRPDEHWRLFGDLRGRARYVDIETTGLEVDAAITLVGISDGRTTRTLVRGVDLTPRRLAQALEGARLLVTFAGRAFDLPRLERAFPHLPWRLPSFDLAEAGRRVGLRGGLKAIERRLVGERDPDLDGLSGAEAVALWRAHERGCPRALPRLSRYNQADVDALVALAPLVHARLERALGASTPGWLASV